MPEDTAPLDTLSRVELMKIAQQFDIADADVMTRPELRAAIRATRSQSQRPEPKPPTWLGVARRLVASVVEQGLNLPDAASMIRGDVDLSTPSQAPPVATVTLARIYAAQGHLDRAINTLRDVIRSEPDHEPAAELLAQFISRADAESAPTPPSAKDDSPPSPTPATPDTAAVPRVANRSGGEQYEKLSAKLLLVMEPGGASASVWWDVGGPLQTPIELVLVHYRPGPGGSVREERRRPLAATRGWLRLQEIPHGGALRAAILKAGGHKPRAVAVAALVETPMPAAPGSSNPPHLSSVKVHYQASRRQKAEPLVDAARSCQAVATPMTW